MTHVSPFRHVARSLPMVTEQHKYKTFSSALVFPSKKNTLLYLGIATCFGYGPGSSVGIATELRAGRSGDRIPLGRVFPSVQTGPEAHPASCTMGTGSFPGVNYGRAVLLTPHPLLVPWSWKGRAIPLPTLWVTTGPVTETLYLFYIPLKSSSMLFLGLSI